MELVEKLDRLMGQIIFEDINNKEMEDWFEERTRGHIERVQQAASEIVEEYPEFKELLEIVKVHDASKFEEPERTPYISLTWRHKLEDAEDDYDPINNKGYQTPGMLEKEDENTACVYHIQNNTHHPEYWLEDKDEANINSKDRNKSDKIVDASKMPDIAIAEMISDWAAMSREIGKNTVREWYDAQKDVRWHFSNAQDILIDKLLKVFED